MNKKVNNSAQQFKRNILFSIFFLVVGIIFVVAELTITPVAEAKRPNPIYYAQAESDGGRSLNKEEVFDTGASGGVCGGAPNDTVKTIINIGCRGRGNAILDMTFALIRVLSVGVGILVIGSIIYAGIQYVTSAGDPQNTAKAIDRIRNTVIALLLYIFAFVFLNWLVPSGVL